MSGFFEWITRRRAFKPGTINSAFDLLLLEAVKQLHDGGFGPAPFGGVILAEDVGDTHGLDSNSIQPTGITEWAAGEIGSGRFGRCANRAPVRKGNPDCRESRDY